MEDDLAGTGDLVPDAGGRIDRLEISNFKSYKGDHLIGPFKNFTAIIGPNGSGKSNLMDAISFVLGVRTQQLRGNLKELLYNHSEGSIHDRPRKGHVKFVYETEDGEQISFTRAIQPSSSEPDGGCTSVYKINDRNVSWEAYADKLGGFGILVKVRNFLVFQVRVATAPCALVLRRIAPLQRPRAGACSPLQGDIEKVASRSPEGLTQLFEQISGSDALKSDYDQLEKEWHRSGGQPWACIAPAAVLLRPPPARLVWRQRSSSPLFRLWPPRASGRRCRGGCQPALCQEKEHHAGKATEKGAKGGGREAHGPAGRASELPSPSPPP